MRNGKLKYLIKNAFVNEIPSKILNRKDKMGFPVPLKEWMQDTNFKEFLLKHIKNLFNRKLTYFKNVNNMIEKIKNNDYNVRTVWCLLSLELWYKNTHDKFCEYKNLVEF